MKYLYILLSILFLSVIHSCSNEVEPPADPYGGVRDLPFNAEQVKFYIDGELQTQVQSITPHSKPLTNEHNTTFPWYYTTLHVKGLIKKGKIFKINVYSDVDRFEGETEIKGVKYAVTGEFIGNPFEYFITGWEIIVHLNKIQESNN